MRLVRRRKETASAGAGPGYAESGRTKGPNSSALSLPLSLWLTSPPRLVGVVSTSTAQCLQLLCFNRINTQGRAGEHGAGHRVSSGLSLLLAESWKHPASHSINPGVLPALLCHLRQASMWLRTKPRAMYMPPTHQVVLTVHSPQPSDKAHQGAAATAMSTPPRVHREQDLCLHGVR